MADKKISQLDLAAQINNDAVIPMSQENGGEETTYKALITALGAKIAEGLTFSNLATTAKNLVGAINELQAGGGGGGAAILIGITTPSSSQGSNGNLYIKYTEGVGGADDTVDAIYVKLDGTWCEVTTDYADLLNKPSINNNTLSGNKTNSDLGIYGKTIEMSSTDPDFVADRITALETSVSGKADTSALAYKLDKSAIKYIEGSGQTDANGILTATGMGVTQLDFDHHIILAVQSSYNGTCVNVGQYNKNFYFVCTSASGLANPIANTTLSLRIIYMDKWW